MFDEAELRAVTEWMATVSGPDMTADDAAAAVIDGIEANRLHVAPNGSIVGVRARVDRLIADLDAGVSVSEPGIPASSERPIEEEPA